MDNNVDAGLPPQTIPGNASGPSPPPPKPGPLFDRADWQSFGLAAFLVFGVYLFTLSPSIDLSWAGIFSTGAMYGGVPHPPGFPLWTIYAHLFTVLVPFSNIAWRVSVSSAFASAFACGLIALMVSRFGAHILKDLRGIQPLDAISEKCIRLFAGCAAGMSFGLSRGVWADSVIVDWWPLTFAVFAAVICLVMRWSYAPGQTRYLYAAFFLYGLALTNSQSLIVALFGLLFLVLLVDSQLGRDLFALATLLFVSVLNRSYHAIDARLWLICLVSASVCFFLAWAMAFRTRRVFTRWKAAFGCMALTALGLCLYFYCPIASMTNPPVNWAYPRTVDDFFHLVERGQYEGLHPTEDFQRYGQQIELYWGYIIRDYGWLYLIPALIPFFTLHRMQVSERRWMLGLLVMLLCESLFLLALLNPGNDNASRDLHRIYLAPSFLVLAIWIGCGLALLGAMLTRPARVPLEQHR